jgi:hypothetical protein
MEIFDTNDSFVFEKLVLTKPTSIPGGNYFIRFLANGQPLYIQPPKCKTRQGVVKAGKRFYSDLMFTNENEDFIRWMENLENYCQQYIYKNREKWFEGDMDLHDIENYFTSPLKLFKSGKYYIARTNITTVLGKPTLKIYDENEKEIDFENINDDTNVMTILEIQGIKCSAKSFQIEVELKQMMVLHPTDIFEKCIIKSVVPVNIMGNSPDNNEKINIPLNGRFAEPLRGIVGVPKELNLESRRDSLANHRFSGESSQRELSQENDDTPDSATVDLRTIAPGATVCDLLPGAKTQDFEGFVPKISINNEIVQECPDANDDKIQENNYSDVLSSDSKSIEIDVGLQPSPDQIQEPNKNINEEDSLEEVEFHLEDFNDSEPIIIKNRNNVYYEMYKEARKKAKIARDLALSTYLEAKRIKNTYMLEDLDDEDESGDEDESNDDEEESGDEDEEESGDEEAI